MTKLDETLLLSSNKASFVKMSNNSSDILWKVKKHTRYFKKILSNSSPEPKIEVAYKDNKPAALEAPTVKLRKITGLKINFSR